jgi:hypothetical protein
MLKNKVLSGMLVLMCAVFLFGSSSHLAHATAGDIQVTVTEEGDGAAVSGATVLVECTGGAYTALTGSPTTNGSGVVLAAPQAGSSCDNGDAVSIQVAKDGYVTGTSALGTYTAASDPNPYAFSGLQFAYKVTGVTSEGASAALAGATVTTGDTFGTTCVASGSAWYCAVPLANTGIAIKVAKDGYVTNSGTSFGADRVAATDAQQTASVSGVQFALKVTVANAFSTPVHGATVTAGDSFGTTCSENGSTGIYYCAIPLANTGVIAKVVSTGNDTITTGYTDRTVATDPQGVLTLTTNVSASGNITLSPTASDTSSSSNTTTSSSSTSTTSTASTTSTTTPSITTTVTVPATATLVAGCTGTTMFSPTTGQSCAGTAMSSTGNETTIISPAMTAQVPTSVTAHSPKASIQALQSDLNLVLGANLAPQLVVDGLYGPKTTAAIKQFQTWFNTTATTKLVVDGKVGTHTSSAINASMK